MKIDCPKCGSGVGVLSIREGSAKCPSCAHEFEAGEHIARLSSRRMPTGPPAAPRGAAPGTTTRDESLPQKTAPEASPYEVTPEDVKPTDDTHRIPPPTPSRRKMQLSASSTASSRADVIAAL